MLQRAAQHPALRRLLWPVLAVRRAVLSRRQQREMRRVIRLTDLFVDDPVVRIDAFEGEFALSPRSDLFGRIVAEGVYEPELADVCRRYLDPERDAIDVGTNVGFFTVLMARHLPGRRVLSIEPTEGALARLERNVQHNGVADRVVVFPGAVADEEGIRGLSVIEGREEYASLGGFVHEAISDAPGQTVDVAVSTVDALVREHGLAPGFMKVDVEGAELAVFQGAVETLRTHRPVILSEFSPVLLEAQGASADAILGLLRELDYVVTNPLRPGALVGSTSYGDLLAVPAERA